MVGFITSVCGRPHFFEDIADGNIHHKIINQLISVLQVEEHDCWLQQDSTMRHKSNKIMTFLWEFFSDYLISKDLWPPLWTVIPKFLSLRLS
jgi:hypothetical protein